MVKRKKSIPKRAKDLFKIEDVSGELSDRQRLFCMEYIKCKFNGTKAAKNAGYSSKTSNEQAARLLANVSINNYVELLKKDLGLRIGISQEKIALEMAKIGFVDIKEIFEDNGNMKALTSMTSEARGAIAGIEIIEMKEDGLPVGTIKKIKLWDKQKALSDLNLMLGYNKPTEVINTIQGALMNFDPLSNEPDTTNNGTP